jgi:RNA polymerase sigma-70 factor, ECF subfamily
MTTTLTGPGLEELEQHRNELRGYCYRMLGSAFDADDAVQDTLVKAWQSRDAFEGRSSVRSWLYRIATNTCLDMLRARSRRALPMDLSSPVPATTSPDHTLPDAAWLEPVPDADVAPMSADPRCSWRTTSRSGWPSSPRCRPCRRSSALR